MERYLFVIVPMGALAALLLNGSGALAGTPSPFGKLEKLDQRAERHRIESRRLERTIDRWDRSLEGTVREGRLAEQAASRLRRKVGRRLVAWEKIHRATRRRSHRWKPGEGRDLRELLSGPEVETLREQREAFDAIGRLRAQTVTPDVLMTERARLTVELAQHRAAEETAEAEGDEVVEQSRAERRDEQIDTAMQQSQRQLEETLKQLIEHETGKDFHRRKGTLLPPVAAEADETFGPKGRESSVTYVPHTGLTYRVDVGVDVRTVADGLVVLAKRFEGYGNLVIVDHGDGYHSLYAHLEEMEVEVGGEIGQGTTVGRSGATDSLDGPKLYFELRHDDEPIDPSPWFLRRESEATE
jgi:septal ring factor EnvC (AmiA/AmiB activator)